MKNFLLNQHVIKMNNREKYIVTGGCGFIGHHMVEYLLKNTDGDIYIIDRLDNSGCINRLTYIEDWELNKKRVFFVWHDLKSEIHKNEILMKILDGASILYHIAAASHVDRSIEAPLDFVMDNVVGTCNILNFARLCPSIKAMVYFSTDEVFGPAMGDVSYKEWDRYCSGNPYSASKAGGEELCLAFHNTYGVPVMISHCMNVFGERQHPEKFIPKCIRSAYKGEKLYIHANKNLTIPGSRFYIHANNVCSAVDFIIKNGKAGEKYNIVGEKEIDNLSLGNMIADIIGKKLNYELVDFHSSRPGHDLRYALDGTKLKDMGWKMVNNLEQSLEKVIKWTMNNETWL